MLKERTIDLVVPKEQDMTMLLEFLVWKLETVDGRRGTASGILNVKQQEDEGKYKKGNNRVFVSPSNVRTKN